MAKANAICYDVTVSGSGRAFPSHPLPLTMNLFLWILQALLALVYGASGAMKTFFLEKVRVDVPSFGALPSAVWIGLGVLELLCVVGLIVPSALRWHPLLTVVAAAILALESLLFVWVHVQYREVPPIVMCCLLGLVAAFVAYGRWVLHPLV